MKRNIALSSLTLVLSLLVVTPAAFAQSYFPATGIFNGFLNQTNISECENTNATAVNITMSITDSAGTVLGTHSYSIAGSGSAHIILNDIAPIADKIGTYTLVLPQSQLLKGDNVNCRTSFYRAAVPGSPKAFEYAYVLPIENPKVGNLSGIYNSIDPSNAGNVTSNWLSIVNRDTTNFSGNVEIRGADGSVIANQAVSNLAPTQRVDIPLGHPSGQVTGVYTVIPDSPSHLYDAVLIRYNPSSNGYNFAFPLQAISATCSGAPVSVSTMNNGWTLPWVETANLGAVDAAITITVRDREGNVLHTEDRTVSPYQQHHFFAGSVIDPTGTGNVGTVQVSCEDPTDRVIVQATHYGRDVNDTQIRWAYSSQVRGNAPADVNSTLVLPVNTFAGIYNWGKLSDASGSGGTLDWTIYNYLGDAVASGANALAAGGSIDHDLHTPMGANSVGFVQYSTADDAAEYSGEILRVTLRSDNSDIATITPIPGVVKQNSSNGSFVGNPQSLAPYRDTITTDEAVRLLQVTEFGGSLNRISDVQSLGLSAAVDQIVDCVNNSDNENIASSVRAEAADWMDGTLNGAFTGTYDVRGLERYWITYMLGSSCPMKEKLAMMLNDRFAANCDLLNQAPFYYTEEVYCKEHLDRLRGYSNGSYKELSREMSTSFLMLIWLNGNSNKCSSQLSVVPDQNWARENFELFNLGANTVFGAGMKYPIYTQTDIERAAGAAAGYATTYDDGFGRNVVTFSPSNHCDEDITLWEGTPFETTDSFKVEDLATVMYDRRPMDAGRYVGSMVFNTFCHAYPSDQLKNQLAEILIANEWKLEPVVKAVLKSEACYSPTAHNSRVKDPLTHLIGFIRATGMKTRSDRLYNEISNTTGSEGLLRPTDVFGFKWLATRDKDSVESLYNNGFIVQFLNALVNLDNGQKQDFVGPDAFNWCDLAPSSTASSEEEIDYLATIMGVSLSTEQRDKLIYYLDNTLSGNPPTVTPSLFDPRVQQHCNDRIFGALWIMAHLPNVITY